MQDIDMRDEIVRRKIFWLLQRISSYTLWRKKRDSFRTFAAAYETAVKTWSPNDPEMVSGDYLAKIYGILSLYDKGLNELARGRRFVWRKDEALECVVAQSSYLSDYFYRNPEYWERGGQFLPYPPKVDALARLLRASMYQGEEAPLEVAGTSDQFAQLRYPGWLLDKNKYNYNFYELEFPTFPGVLPEIPEPRGQMIRSGEVVPCDGIWEPMSIESTRVTNALPLDVEVMRNAGCFNYFVAQTLAPNLSQLSDDQWDVVPVRAHWRLLWEDTRYKDGTIPDESAYFLAPARESQPRRPVSVPPVRTGELCPVSGEWRTEEFGGKTVRVEEGQTMPDMLATDNLGDRAIHWVTWVLVRDA
ncbi:Imm72 family immunity protein [Paraburkholderia guartelaensis]|uniref:Imm72 family immunity protein n=1 Tax=Paraburkholderia guartelaensis TaxID=2546446 RepID=UPI002AB76963|nr:Imm72 family immunity protein [Paraburkholderia guartelaensis]